MTNLTKTEMTDKAYNVYLTIATLWNQTPEGEVKNALWVALEAARKAHEIVWADENN